MRWRREGDVEVSGQNASGASTRGLVRTTVSRSSSSFVGSSARLGLKNLSNREVHHGSVARRGQRGARARRRRVRARFALVRSALGCSSSSSPKVAEEETTMGTVVVRDEWDVDVAGRARAHLRRHRRRRQRPPRRARRHDARASCASRTRRRTPRRRDALRRGSRSRHAGRRDDRSRSGRARARAASRRWRTRAPPRSRGRPCRSPEILHARRGRSLGRERRDARLSARQPTASDRGGRWQRGASSPELTTSSGIEFLMRVHMS